MPSVFIPNRNIIHNQRQKALRDKKTNETRIEYLARRFRAGLIAADDVPAELANEVTLWLLEHKK